ncbi:phosphohistidine phosphatase SixA [bacterium]
MNLYLVRHGESLPKEKDYEQGLSAKGIDDIKKIANIAKESGLSLSVIKHSAKKRAKQTAEIFAEYMHPINGVSEMQGLNPLDEVSDILIDLENENNIMLVGHLPFMERLVSYLITGSQAKKIITFHNGTIVAMEKDIITNEWTINWKIPIQIY